MLILVYFEEGQPQIFGYWPNLDRINLEKSTMKSKPIFGEFNVCTALGMVPKFDEYDIMTIETYLGEVSSLIESAMQETGVKEPIPDKIITTAFNEISLREMQEIRKRGPTIEYLFRRRVFEGTPFPERLKASRAYHELNTKR